MTPVTLFLSGIEPRPAVLEFPMPDLATCESKGRALVADSAATRRFEFVCLGHSGRMPVETT